MWRLTLLLTIVATPVFADSYTALFHDPTDVIPGSGVVSIPDTTPVANPVVIWGNPLTGSNRSALNFAGAVNAPPLDPTVPQPIGSLTFSNGQLVTGTEIASVGLRILSNSGESADLRININNTLNSTDVFASADFITLANPGFCPSPSNCSPNGLTPDLRAFEDNAVSAGLYATQGSIILAGIGPVHDPTTGFRAGSLNASDTTPLPNTANVPNLIDRNGRVFANPDFQVVPEPATWLLLASGLPILFWLGRTAHA
jgi:hypothetical protein